jgi:hypothetical protein
MALETLNQQRAEKIKERARGLNLIIILMGVSGVCAFLDGLETGSVKTVSSWALSMILLIGILRMGRKRSKDRNLKPPNTQVSRSDSK